MRTPANAKKMNDSTEKNQSGNLVLVGTSGFAYKEWKGIFYPEDLPAKKYLSYSFIPSIIILSQSLGLIYFFHITNTFHFLSLLYIYTWLFFIRSLISIYHQTFSDY